MRTIDKAIHAQHRDASQMILHSDQSVQFTSIDFTSFCEMRGITQSMSRAGKMKSSIPQF
ncbi:DDE-type integrase/transposase/recombinase [Clostridium boliviensis]|uniref:DDE-type integrase/transposase/recombinase n=1 Tax=Clostridium boliviensis TaxID=318465 RepID=UPI0034DE6DB4